MKFVDRIIEDIPMLDIEKEESEYHNECKYLADSRIILDNLREYEVEIPTEYFKKYEQVFGNGVLQYMEELTDKTMEDFNGGNTYNWCGKIIHDFDYRDIQVDRDTYYIAIQVHRFGDIRGNYTEFALFKFGSFEEFVEIALAKVHAEAFADSQFSSVSDGQRQRILLARALCQNPKVLVLDEPTSYLDIRWRLELFSLIRELAASGVTVIMAVHEIDFAEKVSDRILCVEGESCRMVSPEELSQNGVIQSLYGLEGQAFDPLLGTAELPPLPGKPEVFVISSCGGGIPVYRMLRRRQTPFAAGILYTNDVDYRVARMLASELISAVPFEPIPDEALAAAKKCIDGCAKVIAAGLTIGSCNCRMKELLEYSEGKLWQNPL